MIKSEFIKRGHENVAIENIAHGLKVLFVDLQKPTQMNMSKFWANRNVPYARVIGTVLVKHKYIKVTGKKGRAAIFQWLNGEPSLHVARELYYQCKKYVYEFRKRWAEKKLKAVTAPAATTESLNFPNEVMEKPTKPTEAKHRPYYINGVHADAATIRKVADMILLGHMNEEIMDELRISKELIGYYVREALIHIAQMRLNKAWGRIVELEKSDATNRASINNLQNQVEVMRRLLHLVQPQAPKKNHGLFPKIKMSLKKISFQNPIQIKSFIKIAK